MRAAPAVATRGHHLRHRQRRQRGCHQEGLREATAMVLRRHQQPVAQYARTRVSEKVSCTSAKRSCIVLQLLRCAKQSQNQVQRQGKVYASMYHPISGPPYGQHTEALTTPLAHARKSHTHREKICAARPSLLVKQRCKPHVSRGRTLSSRALSPRAAPKAANCSRVAPLACGR